MDYKNLYIRSIISIVLLFLYIISLSSSYLLFLLGVTMYFFVFYEIYKNFKKNIIIFFYFTLSFSSFIYYIFYYFDIYFFNLLIFVIISFDTFSYLIGKLFGKRKIFHNISPHKTLEGYFGGLIITNLIYVLYNYVIFKSTNILLLIILNLLIITSLLGDLLQSYFKRKSNIKDSSNLLPGHGGFFDRFDSFISSIILLFLYSVFIL